MRIQKLWNDIRTVMFVVLHDKFGFSTKRLVKFRDCINAYVLSPELSISDLEMLLNQKYNVNIKRIVYDIPLRLKLKFVNVRRVDGHELSIADNTLISLYSCALTALKTQFKFSKANLDKFLAECSELFNMILNVKCDIKYSEMYYYIIKEETKFTDKEMDNYYEVNKRL